VMPRLRASCCSGSTSSASGPEERRRVVRVRTGECVDDVRRRWVLAFEEVEVLSVGGGVSSMVESSCFRVDRIELRAVLWDCDSWARERKVSVLFTRKRRHSWIWIDKYMARSLRRGTYILDSLNSSFLALPICCCNGA